MEQAVRRVHHRLRVLAVRGERGLARRREFHALGFDRPRRAVILGEVDRDHAHDLVVLDVDEHRAAVGHVAIAHGAVGELVAVPPADGLHHHDGLREPVGVILGPVDAEHEVLLRIDLVEPVDRRRQQAGADRGVLEHQLAVGAGMQARPRTDLPLLELEPAADLLVARHDLRHQVALLEPRAERRVTKGLELQQLRQAKQDDRELEDREVHVSLLSAVAGTPAGAHRNQYNRRHPEVRAQRASKDAAPAFRAILRGPLRGLLGRTAASCNFERPEAFDQGLSQ